MDYISEENLDNVASKYVDPAFIDNSSARYEASGVLTAVFHAEFFGDCIVRKAVVDNVENDLKIMAFLAGEVFERKHTECASHGMIPESDRPVEIPEGFTIEYIPCDD